MAKFIIMIGQNRHPETFNRMARAEREAKRLFRRADEANYDLDLRWQTHRDGTKQLVASQPYAYGDSQPWLTGYKVMPEPKEAK